MPFSGFLVSTGRFNLHLVVLAGAFGNLLGSLAAYALGYWGHERLVRRFIRRFGKWILLTEEELDSAEKMLHKYKDQFDLSWFIGLVLSTRLCWFYNGRKLGAIGSDFHSADAVIIVLILLAIGFYI